MIRKTAIIASIFILGACSLSCSDRFMDTNAQLIDTARIVYKHRSFGDITEEEAFRYQKEVEEAYAYTVDGSVLCDVDAQGAADKFEAAQDILDAIGDALGANGDSKTNITKEKGE